MRPTGYLLINKPKGITSFQCIRHIKRCLGLSGKPRIKIGHAGTLDPFATGLLIVCIGRETTKTISHLLNLDKTYVVKAKLGELTDTLDLTGTIIETCDASTVTHDDLVQAITSLGTEYVQIPPIYSALKHKGQPLYKLARENKVDQKTLAKIIESKKRTVMLHTLELLSYEPPFFTFKAHVSKGTYIRSLANDIAGKAGNIATTYELERTQIGSIPLAKAVPLATITNNDDVVRHLLPGEQLSLLLK